MAKLIATVYKAHLMGGLPTVALEEQVAAIEDTTALHQELEKAFDEAGNGTSMCKALEDLAFVVDQIKELTPREASLIQIAGDMAVAGTDTPAEAITPSMESIFDGKLVAADIAKKIRDTVEHIIKAIRALIAKASTYVTSYISRATVVAGGSETRLKKLEEAYKHISATSSGRKDLDMVLPTISGQSINSMQELLAGSKSFLQVLDKFTKVMGDSNYNFGSGFVRLYEHDLGKGEDNEKHRDTIVNLLRDIAKSFNAGKALPHSKSLTGDDGSSITETESLIGGVKVSVVCMDPAYFDQTALHSSVSVRDLVSKTARKNGVTVSSEESSTTARVTLEAMTDSQIRQGFDMVKELLKHYSARDTSNSLSAAMKKRSDFARQCSSAIVERVKKLEDGNGTAYALSVEAVGVTEAITRNATISYSRMSEATGRLISYLLTALSKSIRAHAEAEGTKP